MNDIALWIIRFVLAYMGMVPVCALIFWLVDILISSPYNSGPDTLNTLTCSSTSLR